jgi:putative membrane protein
MLLRPLSAAPKPLLVACGLFFLAAYFPTRFPDVPGSSVASYVSTVAIALPSFVALARFLGPRGATLSLLALGLFGYAIETTGVVTGFPYGPFFYGDALGPKLAGLVPYLLPVSYVPLVLGAVGATAPRKAASGQRVLRWVLLAAVLLTLLDGVLDPGAVALGFWVWPEGGPYYGVPVSNYFGWLLSSTLAAALLLAMGRGRWERGTPPPGLLDSALISTSFWTGVAVFSGLAFPVLLGAGLFTFLLRRRARLAESASGRV